MLQGAGVGVKGELAMQSTRQAILNILKEQGQATVEQLSSKLSLTPVTIRHHLDILRSEGLVQAPKVKRRQTPGRPQHVYNLTEQANSYFPKNYVAFADLTLAELRDRISPEEMDSIVKNVAKRMASDVQRPVAGEPLSHRLNRLVTFLNDKGYVARWESNAEGLFLHTTNCPYQGLMEHHNAPCVMDLAIITDVLGVTPQRLSWMGGGDTMCTYRVPELDGHAAPAA